jgi:hypothetical protein
MTSRRYKGYIPVNIKEVVGLMGGALRVRRRRGGKVGSGAVVIDALRRFGASERGSRGVPRTGRGGGSIATKDRKV